MKISFYDPSRRHEVISFEGNLSDAPLVGDTVILLPTPEYEKIYGYSNRTATIESRHVDYRDNSVTLYIN